MLDEPMVRCIDPACARMLARRVNYCPYCGTAQHDGVAQAPVRQAPAPAAAPAFAPAAAPVAAAAAPSAATPAGAAEAPVPQPAAATAAPPASQAPPARPAPPAAQPASPAPRPAPPRAAPAAPPRRQPVRLRWWLLALALLWAVWLVVNPAKRRIEAQVDKAIALAAECKARDAQSELIALRKTRATPEQLRRVQQALNEAGATCARKRQRDKAWREAKAAIESALAQEAAGRARERLRAFTRRWGEDEATRALRARIDARHPEHPRADEIERD